jgi:hypothetical protein
MPVLNRSHAAHLIMIQKTRHLEELKRSLFVAICSSANLIFEATSKAKVAYLVLPDFRNALACGELKDHARSNTENILIRLL